MDFSLSQTRKGIFSLILALFVFTAANAFLKTVEQVYPPTQMVFFRNLFSLIPYLLFMIFKKEHTSLKINNIPTHMARGFLGVISLSCLFQSIILLPLSDAITLSYACVFFVILLSVPLLKEQIDPQKWLSVILGFTGVLIIVRPSWDIINWGALYALLSAFFEAFLMVHGRKLTQVNSNSAIVLYYAVFAILFSGMTLPFVWIKPTSYDLLILICLGIGGGIGQYLLTEAYRQTQASILAPYIYTSLLWSIGFGYLTLGEIPSTTLLMGAPLIIMAGLLRRKMTPQSKHGSS